MGKLSVFNNVSLDGYFADAKGDMSWAHVNDPEWIEFVEGNAQGGDGILLFGRVTYDMMAAWWPTAAAKQAMPKVAEGMNRRRKVVFSRKLDKANWENTRLIKTDLPGEAAKLKKTDDVVILGSGSIVSQLTEAGLIDEYQVVVHPVILGKGRTLFETVKNKVPLKLARTRSFKNGRVVLWYERA